MGLLDGGLKAIVGSAFSPLLRDGTLHKRSALVADGRGGWIEGAATDIPVKLLFETYSAFVRDRDGIPITSVKVTMLQAGIAQAPTREDSITGPDPVNGSSITVKVADISSDPASATWTIRGDR